MQVRIRWRAETPVAYSDFFCCSEIKEVVFVKQSRSFIKGPILSPLLNFTFPVLLAQKLGEGKSEEDEKVLGSANRAVSRVLHGNCRQGSQSRSGRGCLYGPLT